MVASILTLRVIIYDDIEAVCMDWEGGRRIKVNEPKICMAGLYSVD